MGEGWLSRDGYGVDGDIPYNLWRLQPIPRRRSQGVVYQANPADMKDELEFDSVEFEAMHSIRLNPGESRRVRITISEVQDG